MNGRGARCAGSRPLRHYRDRRRAASELQPHTSVLGAGGREDACRNRHSTFQLVREARHSLDRRQTGARTGAASAARSTNRSTCCRGLSRPRVLDWPRHIWLLGRYRVQSDGEWCLPASPISITNSIGGCAIDPRKPKCATPFAGSRRFIRSMCVEVSQYRLATHLVQTDTIVACNHRFKREPQARHLRSMYRPASRIAGAPIATAKEHADEQTEPKLDFGLEPRE